MRVLGDRIDGAARFAGIRSKAVQCLAYAPAVVQATSGTSRLEVDLLVGVLPNIADIQVAGGAVEREAPGVAQPVSPDLRTRIVGAGRPGIIGRNGIGFVAAHVQTQQLT